MLYGWSSIDTMKSKKLYFITLTALVASIASTVISDVYRIEWLSLPNIVLFPSTSILIAVSLTYLTRPSFKKSKYYAILLFLLFGIIAGFANLFFYVFAYRNFGGESGMIFGGIFGVLGGIVVCIISLILSIIISNKINKTTQYNKSLKNDALEQRAS